MLTAAGAQVRGYAKLYNNVSDYGIGYMLFSVVVFFLFTGACMRACTHGRPKLSAEPSARTRGQIC